MKIKSDVRTKTLIAGEGHKQIAVDLVSRDGDLLPHRVVAIFADGRGIEATGEELLRLAEIVQKHDEFRLTAVNVCVDHGVFKNGKGTYGYDCPTCWDEEHAGDKPRLAVVQEEAADDIAI